MHWQHGNSFGFDLLSSMLLSTDCCGMNAKRCADQHRPLSGAE